MALSLGLKQTSLRRHGYVKVTARHKDGYECNTVFQSSSNKRVDTSFITIQDVEDHLHACQRLKDTDKEDYFLALGMDYKRCSEYINIVKYMNRCYSKSNKTHKPQWLQWTVITTTIAFIYNYINEDL